MSTGRAVPGRCQVAWSPEQFGADRVTADGGTEFPVMTTTDNRAGSNMAIRPVHAQADRPRCALPRHCGCRSFTPPTRWRRDQFLSRAYDGGWRMKDLSLRSLTYRRYDAPALRLDEVSLTGTGRCALHATDHVTVVARGGWLDRTMLPGPWKPPSRPWSPRTCRSFLNSATVACGWSASM